MKAQYDIRFEETKMKSSTLTTLRASAIISLFCASAILSSAQTKFTSLLSFNGSNGADPHYVNLVQGEDGELYGTTFVSTGSGGTVFKVTTAGALTTLHAFCQGANRATTGPSRTQGCC
jgi:uncharacterized repeat protein (TIGR03803 family)